MPPIYAETHGAGSSSSNAGFAFSLSPGSSSGRSSEWYGTVWAPYAGIKIGSQSDIAKVVGALWSNQQVQIKNNTTIDYAPFNGASSSSDIDPYYPPTVKVTTIIGSELTSLYLNRNSISAADNQIYIIRSDSVYIEAIAQPGQYAALLALLQTVPYGLTDILPNDASTLVITGKYPIANLNKLNSLTSLINYCRPLFPPIFNSGAVNSAGDTAMLTHFVHKAFNIQGEGIKVGVLSDSYNAKKRGTSDQAQVNVRNDDLPGMENPNGNIDAVHIVKENQFGGTDEGRAMLQIVHDMAPKAKLAFRTGFLSAGDLAAGIEELQQDGYDIVMVDITYITEPFYQDGVVAKKVNDVVGQGVAYFLPPAIMGGVRMNTLFQP